MKTTFCIRLFITIVVITATACSDPFEQPERSPLTTPKKILITEFRTTVTAWNRTTNNRFIGLISTTPFTDLTKVHIYGIKDGQRILIDNYGDISQFPYGDQAEIPLPQSMHDGYIWAHVKSNVLLLNYKCTTEESFPPFPLEIVIVY